MPFSSSVSPQLLSLTQAVCMLGAQWLKVRNGQQQRGFMLILLRRIWQPVATAQILMRVVRDGLFLVSAPRTQSIWLDLQRFLAIVGEVAKYVSCTLHAFTIVSGVGFSEVGYLLIFFFWWIINIRSFVTVFTNIVEMHVFWTFTTVMTPSLLALLSNYSISSCVCSKTQSFVKWNVFEKTTGSGLISLVNISFWKILISHTVI